MIQALPTNNELNALLAYLTPQERDELDRLLLAPVLQEPVRNPEFRGHALDLQAYTEREVVLSGMARTGKSFAALYKLHTLAEKFSGMRGLIIRKTRESLNESALLTFERDVLGVDNPIISNGQRNSRHSYRYDNGSEIIVAGIQANGKDQKARIMSTEYDMIYVQEATEIMETEWQKLTTRLSNFRAPYQQIIGDCNPDAPTHWIYRNHLAGRLALWNTTLQDNPRWWIVNPNEPKGGHWTREGSAVYDTLSKLTGVDNDRYFKGLWVQATGLVYGDVWADGPSDGNVTEQAEYVPDGGAVLWFVDDGYAGELDARIGTFTGESHPRVFLLCQLRATGILCVFAEHYAVKKLADVHLQDVQGLGYPSPDWAAVDKSAAELRGRLHNAQIYTRQGPASVEESIKVLRDWIAPDANGVRRLLVHPRCHHLRSEMAAYRRDTDGKIVKAFDHGPDAARYGVWALRYNQ